MSYEFAKEEIGDYRITIYQDEDAECPCTAWDLVGVYFWDYSDYGYSRSLSRGCSSEVDAKNAEEALKKVNEANDNGEIEIDYEDNYSGEQIELDNDQDYWRDVDNENGDTLQHID